MSDSLPVNDQIVKVLLDTDIGSDVDDAVCLAYLLANPQCELMGITTVTGEADKRAMLASTLCQVAGKQVPIFSGSENPMVGEQLQKIAQQAEALPRWPHQTEFPRGEAIEFMRSIIRANPGEIILLAIGPFTNIGQLFSADPDIASLLKGLVLMSGCFSDTNHEEDQIEWNVNCDPLAAEIVYRSPVSLHRTVSLNVTRQVVMPAEEIRKRFTVLLLKPVLDFAEIWFAQSNPCITFHDPLTAATIFYPSLCEYQQGIVTFDQVEKPGRTLFKPCGEQGPHMVATSVKVQRFFDHFFGVF